MTFTVTLADAADASRFGGKASQLALLARDGAHAVPPGFAVDAAAFDRTVEALLPPAQRPERLVNGSARDRRPDRLEAIRQRVLAGPLPTEVSEAVVRSWRALGGPVVAVRSSALHEDSEGASAAGLHETVLGVQDEDSLRAAVLRCYASLWQERALAYLVRLGAKAGRLGVALVVQKLVRADAAGVLFTVDPLRGEGDCMWVEAAVGLGTSVVDGVASPDVFRLDRATGKVLAAQVQEKSLAVRPGAGGGVERVAVPEDERSRPAVTDAQLAELAAVGRALEAKAGAPRDVEWAWEDGRLWVLQARPVVGFAKGARRSDADLWSNVNVGEALPGVATPLTWSIAAAFSELGFRRAFGALGCKVPPGTELVGSFHGRIYLNLTGFVRIASQVPALDAKMLLEFGGGGGLEAVEAQVPKGPWSTFLARLPLVGVRYLAENTALDARVAGFERDFVSERERLHAMDLGALSDRALRGILDEVMALLDRTGAIMLTCASGYLASVVGVRTLLRVVVPRDAERLERELLAGVNDLESAAPGIALFHIAEIARGEPAAREVLLSQDPASLTLSSLPDGPTRRAFTSLLRAYGYRCPREAELMTPRWREAPGTLFAALRAYVERADASALARAERQSTVRAEAERALLAKVSAPTAAAARHLLARTGRFARLRERMRARVTEALGFLRSLALEVSARLERKVPGSGADAAFMLSVEEVRAWLDGGLDDVGPLVAVRRAQYLRDVARPDPPPTFQGAPPASSVPTLHEGASWKAVAASPGVVTGVVRVLRDPAEGAQLRPGEVLVTPVTDVGWTPLFLVAAAVVTELGGALSHASLVAREYGVPAVVNLQGATRALRTGDKVCVDGDRGTVTVVERAPRLAGDRSSESP